MLSVNNCLTAEGVIATEGQAAGAVVDDASGSGGIADDTVGTVGESTENGSCSIGRTEGDVGEDLGVEAGEVMGGAVVVEAEGTALEGDVFVEDSVVVRGENASAGDDNKATNCGRT